MTTIDWILIVILFIAFSAGAALLRKLTKLIAWIPLVGLAISLLGGLAGVYLVSLIMAMVVAPNWPMIANSTIGSWLVLIGSLWLN